MRRRHARTVDGFVRAATVVRPRQDLLECVFIVRVDDYLCTQRQRPFRPLTIRLHADHPRPTIACIDHPAQPHWSQAGDEHGVVSVHLHALERAKGRAESTAGP